eukprot:scaffold731_cov328-Prasinococcus_capsulatus_cf.AAC.2
MQASPVLAAEEERLGKPIKVRHVGRLLLRRTRLLRKCHKLVCEEDRAGTEVLIDAVVHLR